MDDVPSSLLVIHLDKTVRKPDLFKTAQEALSLNKSVIVKNFVDTGSFNFILEDLEEHFMISPHMPVEAHGTSPLPALRVMSPPPHFPRKIGTLALTLECPYMVTRFPCKVIPLFVIIIFSDNFTRVSYSVVHICRNYNITCMHKFMRVFEITVHNVLTMGV